MGPPDGRGGSKPKKKSPFKINSLWSVWYCVLTVGLQLYIVTVSIERFSKYITLPWPLDDQPYLELNAYVGFLGASLVLMPFFILTALLRIGNYPNDGHKISFQYSKDKGVDNTVLYQNVQARRTKQNKGLTSWALTIWRHMGPTSAFIHVASAFCLLLPKLFIHAQLIKHGFAKKGEIWNSELDFLINHQKRLSALPFLSTINETELQAQDFNHPTSNTDPSGPLPLTLTDERSTTLSLEFLNFGLALLVYAVRYSSVFWDASKPFGLLFSFQLLLNGLQQMLAFAGFGVLYKVQIFGPKDVLIRYDPLLLDSTTSVLLFFFYNIAVSGTSCTLYSYGLQKHHEWTERNLRRYHITWGKQRWRLWGYMPHISAFLVLVILAFVTTPLAYDLILVYCGSLDNAILATVISTVSHLLLWMVLWLFLTLKQRWTFTGYSEKHKAYLDLRPMCNGDVSRGTGEYRARMNVRSGKKGEAPLLIVDNGQTYQIREKSSKNAILNFVQNSATGHKTSSSTDDEDIYWLKPTETSSKTLVESIAEVEDGPRTWSREPKRPATSTKPVKVTFEQSVLNASPTRRKPPSKIPKYDQNLAGSFPISGSEDDDYATLTEVPSKKKCETLVHHCSLGESQHESSLDNSSTATMEVTQRDPTGDTVSDTSNSPEKSSDTSSGIHSAGGSSFCGEKRAHSVENISLVVPIPTYRDSPNNTRSLMRNTDQFARATNIKLTTFHDASANELPSIPPYEFPSYANTTQQ